MMRSVEGTVLRMRCGKCGAAFSTFQFSGDTDSVTMGLASASSCAANEVVVAEMTNDEWRALGANGSVDFARRLTAELNRSVRPAVFLRAEARSAPPAGLTFQEFRRAYQPPTLVYSCACCTIGEARVEAECSVEDFIASGGTLTILGNLTVA